MRFGEKIKEGIANWSRLQQILRVLARHGFAGLAQELGLGPFAFPHREEGSDEQSIASHLRAAFEELGPSFIKLGQLLSTRPDLLPEAYIKEFSKLTDRIPGIPFDEIQSVIQSEFGRRAEDLFEYFEEGPIAAASIAQVHRARYRDAEAPLEVVVKVQRPGIEEIIRADIQVLHFMASALERVRPNLKVFHLKAIVEEFQRSVFEELDFNLEGKNIELFRSRLGPEDGGIDIPLVYWSRSSKRVLTMSELKGTPLSQIKEFPTSIDRTYLAESTVNFFLESIFFHGLFHCDAHAGNLLINLEGRGRVGIVDFGMVGRLMPRLQDQLGRVFLALVTRDFGALAMEYSQIAEFGRRLSVREFQNDLERLLGPHLARPLKEVDVAQLMQDSLSIAQKYQVRLPRDLIMFYRAVVTLEHIGRTLDPNFTFLEVGTKFGKRLVRQRFSVDNLSRDLFKAIEGFRSLTVELPGGLKHLLHKIENDELFPQLTQFEKGVESFRQSNITLSLSLVLMAMIIGASILHANEGELWLVWTLWGLSICLGSTILYRLRRRS